MRKIQVIRSIDEDEILDLFPSPEESDYDDATEEVIDVREIIHRIYDIPQSVTKKSLISKINYILDYMERYFGDGMLSAHAPNASGVDMVLDILSEADRPKSLSGRVKVRLLGAFLEAFEEETPASYFWDAAHDLIDQINDGTGVADDNDYDS